MTTLTESGWQTVGPFFHSTLPWEGGGRLESSAGERIRIVGRIVDGAGAPVADAMVESWQANAAGRYAHPEDDQAKPLDPLFTGFARVATDADGSFVIETVKPGPVPGPGNTLQAPHILLSIFGRGLARRLVTRLYFAGEPGNATDPILDLVPEERRATLIAEPGQIPGDWHFGIRLQGEGETVFFSL